MDNPLSFSLGITQLDATIQDIPLGFVPATFDEQDPDWAENRSKHRNDPVKMKKLTDKAASKSKKSTLKASKKKFDDPADHGMKYRIDKVPPHPLHMGSLCNCAFGKEIKEYFGENDNKNELHVWVQEEILKFTMLNFAIISDLKCTGNIDDYMYTSSSKSALMSRYFPDNKGAITHSKLITRVQNGNFDNAEDALNLAILFFVHTFIFSQHKKAPISVVHFQIVEDESKTVVRQRKVVPRILNWSVQCIRPTHESFMSGMFTKHSYKNIQPTTDEVRRLDLSFSKDFEICDPTTYASTSDSGKLKRTTVEIQQRVGTIAEEFGDFSTIPQREILIKAGFELPVSPDQPLKKRKTVVFEQEKQVVVDDDTSGSIHAIHHGSDLYREMHKDTTDKGENGVSEIQHHHHVENGVSPQSHQYKFVPSLSTQPEGTSKSSLDGDEIKNYINKCLAETMAELITLISKIPAEIFVVIQEDKIDEQQQSQEDGSNKQERQHKSDMQHEDYDKGSLNDMEVSRDEESNKQNLLEEQQLLDVNAADKDAGREDNFKNEHCSDLQVLEDDIMAYEEECSDEELGKKNIPDVEDLPDVNLTAKEDVTEVNLKNQKSTDVTDVQDEVGGTVTDSIQSVVDTILFGLSTPSTTKSLDVGSGASSVKIKSTFQTRKKSRILRSPYISNYGSGSKDTVDNDKEEKLKYAFDGYNINQDFPNELMIDYSQWIVVRLLKTHSAKKETDNHYRVNASGLGFRQLNFVVAYP
ncbi:uncharacterized protein LOC107869360 [Capsicum annuum]|uniref:uncharacterized protein LOC107869360 n=1 Tax=Capsicum annuum TaxID=4072 RepID=UPI001FB093E4|nr:uncharacterized protein LOC107869360 [Capsicum annuum]